MASFASSATTGGARKHAWTKNGSKLDHHYSTILSIPVVGEKQKKRKKKKIGENNGELRFRPPRRVAQASRLANLKGLALPKNTSPKANPWTKALKKYLKN